MRVHYSVLALCAISPMILSSEAEAAASSRFSVAVFGDAPYGCKKGTFVSAEETPEICPPGYTPDTTTGPNPGDTRQLDATPAFIKSVNKDSVSMVLHTGDIHSGSQYCTLAYNRWVANLWSKFKAPLVYTPGDNEWTDCHKSKEGGNQKNADGSYLDYANGNPVANLALVRSLFFKDPGYTLGKRRMRVVSQGVAFNEDFPTDAEYVENVMLERSKVMFVTLNIPGGSNNDDDIWFGAAAKTGEQIQEVSQRTAAVLRWIDTAFDKAISNNDAALVIMEQGDMWDRDGEADASHISNYKVFIDKIAERTSSFAKPVLLINGDSHYYRSDNPLKQGQPCYMEQLASGGSIGSCSSSSVNISDDGDAWSNHPYYDVSNFHRLVVHGSTFPLQYLRLNYNAANNLAPDENQFGPFSWERVIP